MTGRFLGPGGSLIAVLFLISIVTLITGLYLQQETLTIAGGSAAVLLVGIAVPIGLALRRLRNRWLHRDDERRASLHDPLTGLPNQVYFRDRLVELLALAEKREHPMALVIVEIDGFDDIRRDLGRGTANAFLAQAADRLRDCVDLKNLVCKLDGARFAVSIDSIQSLQEAAHLAENCCVTHAETYFVDGQEIQSSASAGIAIGSMNGQSADELMKNADLALQKARTTSGDSYRFFDDAMDSAFDERRNLTSDLQNAALDNELEIFYQPQLELSSGRIVGYEALLRWNHPERGQILPGRFIPIAEETGLIRPIGEWVLWNACNYALSWPDNAKLSINLSHVQFDQGDIAGLVRRVLRETGLPATRLELEITEKLLLEASSSVMENLWILDNTGVSIVLDDFGKGHSSISALSNFPIRKIKIDHTHIHNLGDTKERQSLVNAIIGLGKSLHIDVVAKGVESGIQAGYLRAWGCDLAQGFFYGDPKPEVLAICLDETETTESVVA